MADLGDSIADTLEVRNAAVIPNGVVRKGEFDTSLATKSDSSHTHANDHVAITLGSSNSLALTLATQQLGGEVRLDTNSGLSVVAGGLRVIFGSSEDTVAEGDHVHANDHVVAVAHATQSDSITVTVSAAQEISAVAVVATGGGLKIVAGSGGGLGADFGTTSTTVAVGNHTHSNATTSVAGLMSAADKTKLNGLPSTAENPLTFNESTSIDFVRLSDVVSATVKVASGIKQGVAAIEVDFDVVATAGHVHSDASGGTSGFLSAANWTKLDGLLSQAALDTRYTRKDIVDTSPQTQFGTINVTNGFTISAAASLTTLTGNTAFVGTMSVTGVTTFTANPKAVAWAFSNTTGSLTGVTGFAYLDDIDTGFRNAGTVIAKLKKGSTSLATEDGSIHVLNASDALGKMYAATLDATTVIINGTPTLATHATHKGYVDGAVNTLKLKAPARVATTANITLSGAQTIDGVAVVAGDRVLVKNQTTGSQNGIYLCVDPGAWTRATDADENAEVMSCMFLFVCSGTVNGDIGFLLTTNDPIVVGTTALTFAQFSAAGSIVAGTGLDLTGSTLSVEFGTTAGTVAAGDHTHLTTAVAEGTNLYFTIARARDSVSVTPSALTYDSGVFGINAISTNMANYIVQRDNNGDFAAGHITVEGITVTGAFSMAGASGTGSPEGVVEAYPGATYLDTATDGFYVKKTGAGTNTGWIGLIL